MNSNPRFIGTSKGIINPAAISCINPGSMPSGDFFCDIYLIDDEVALQLSGYEARRLIAYLCPQWLVPPPEGYSSPHPHKHIWDAPASATFADAE